MNTFRAQCFFVANGLSASIAERVNGELQRVDDMPWTAAYILWNSGMWRAWEAQATKDERRPDNMHTSFDAWLSSSCGVSQ